MTHHTRLRGATLLCTAGFALALVACGEAKEGAGAASAEPASSAAAKAPSAKGDPAILAELKKLSACKREDGYRERDCEASDAWDKYVEGVLGEEEDPGKVRKLVAACVAATGEKDDNVREAGYECVGNHPEGVADAKAVLADAIEKVGKEPSAGVRGAMLGAIKELDPTKQGMTGKLVELAKASVDDANLGGQLASIVGTLVPKETSTEPAPEAFALAIDLLGRKKAVDPAIDILARTKTKTKDACDALLKLAETKQHPWGRASDGLSRIDGHCKDQLDRLVEVVVAKAGEGDGYDKGFIGADVIYFQRLVERGVFSDAQKAKLRGAVEGALKAATKDHQKKDYEKLLTQLK